tara:strand:- start:4933 stop:5298 length:366 start_codon:yes stop_codon:yes gene_type:complete
MIPFLYLFRDKETRFKMLLVLLSFLPLFYLAKDWGRWISLIFIIFSVLFISFEKEFFYMNRYLMFLLVVNITFYMNPSCCDVNVLVFTNVPNNVFSNNLSIFSISLFLIFINQLSSKKNKF